MADSNIQAAPGLPQLIMEKDTSVNVQEVSPSKSPTPSLHVKRHERSKRRATRKQKPIDRFFKTCKRQSPFVKALFYTIVSAIPFVVFLLVAKLAYPADQMIDSQGTKVTLSQLAKWLIISWASFMGLLWCGRMFAAFATMICSQSNTLIKYQRVAEALCLRVVLMVWAIVCFYVMPSIFEGSVVKYQAKSSAADKTWILTLQTAFMFLIIAFALIVAQGLVLEMSAIVYIQGWMGPRSQRASDELDTIKQLHDLADPHTDDHVELMGKVIKKVLMPVDEDDLYYQISRGTGSADIWSEYANHIWQTISQGKTSITRFDLDQQLRAMNRDPDRGHELFTQLDESCDGEVTADEVDKLVHRVGIQLNARKEAQHGIDRLLFKLEILLSIVLLAIIFIVWLQFFNKALAANIYSYWTGLATLSFAFGGVVTELSNSCVFVFARHAYDVGDYVEIKGKKMIVMKIFLTHTNFEEVVDPTERGVVVQSSHASMFAEQITNWTRTIEAVIEKRARTTKEDGAVASAKTDAENKATEDVRELVSLKVEQLKGIKSEEKY